MKSSNRASQQLIPIRGYTNAECFHREMNALFGRCWNFVGMTDDIPKVGDFLCAQAGAFPLLVVRDHEGDVRAFHNVCRHRGMRLADQPGSAPRGFTCPYHRWFYKLDGRLTAVPRQSALFPDMDKAELGLIPASTGVFRGMIFVNPESEPEETFSSFSEGLEDNVGPHRPEEMVEIGRRQFEFRANWKIVVENYMDTYHLFHLHHDTLEFIDHNRFRWYSCGRHFMSYEPLNEKFSNWLYRAYGLTQNECVPGVDPRQYGMHIHMFFPGIGWTGMAHSWSSFHVKPISVDRTVVETRMRVMPAAVGKGRFDRMTMPGSGDSSEKVVTTDDLDTHPIESDRSMLEDMWACEQVQLGFQSPAAMVSFFARDYEDMIVAFQRNLLEFVQYDG